MRSKHRRLSTVATAALAAVAVLGLAGCQTMPESGLYASQQHTAAQITTVSNQVYGRATNQAGAQVDLLIDVFLPPTPGSGRRPTVVLIHGGGFTSGNKSQMTSTARGYAQLGFVAASISYRLDPGASSSEARQLIAAQAAIDDGMEAVRWLRSKAATYRIDTDRIAMVGSSAGGAIALGVGAMNDPTPGGPLAAHSPKIRAAVSTGAALTPGIDLGLVTFETGDAPALLYHYESDTVTDFTAAYAKRHCEGMHAAGLSCLFVQQAGRGHTVSLATTSAQWKGNIGTFLWQQLDLFSIV